MTTLERLLELVEAIPPTEREAAARALERLANGSAVTGAEFFASRNRGRAPVLNEDAEVVEDIDVLRGDFWPDDESVDDFVKTLRSWRRDEVGG